MSVMEVIHKKGRVDIGIYCKGEEGGASQPYP